MIPSNPRSFGAIQQMQEHPEWVRDLAYNLWAFVCNQNVSTVWRMMTEGSYQDHGGIVPEDQYMDGYPPPVILSRQAIQKWKQTGRWDDRWATQMRDMQPEIHQKVANNLMVGSLEASEFLSRYLRGDLETTDSTLSKQLDSRARVAQDILSRTGHLPHTRPNDGGPLAAPTTDHRRQFADKSIEELRRMAIEGEVIEIE